MYENLLKIGYFIIRVIAFYLNAKDNESRNNFNFFDFEI